MQKMGKDSKDTQNIQDNQKNFVEELKKEISEIKGEIIDKGISEIKLENFGKEISEIKGELVSFEKTNLDKKEKSGLELLGELLGFLRTTKQMALLMICRRIINIEIKDNIAEIEYIDKSVEEIFTNSVYNEQIRKFFNDRSLDLKQKQKICKESDADKLNKLLGGKLVIKHS